MEEIASRYGLALFSLASDLGKIDDYLLEMKEWEVPYAVSAYEAENEIKIEKETSSSGSATTGGDSVNPQWRNNLFK